MSDNQYMECTSVPKYPSYTHLFCNAKLVDGHNNMTKMIETTVMYHQVLLLDIVVVIPVDLLCGNQMALYENEHSTGAPTF